MYKPVIKITLLEVSIFFSPLIPLNMTLADGEELSWREGLLRLPNKVEGGHPRRYIIDTPGVNQNAKSEASFTLSGWTLIGGWLHEIEPEVLYSLHSSTHLDDSFIQAFFGSELN